MAKFAKTVYGVDSDKRMIDYCKKQQKLKNLFFINQKTESFVKKRNFDVILLAWPSSQRRIIKKIKKSMGKNTFLIIIVNDASSAIAKLYDDFMSKVNAKKWLKIKLDFIKYLKNEFKVIKSKKLKSSYLFPNKKATIKDIEWNLITWLYTKKINEKTKELIEKSIKKYRKGKKYEIPEKVFFLVLKLKGS